jgi:uncharacterized membrane protein YkoI
MNRRTAAVVGAVALTGAALVGGAQLAGAGGGEDDGPDVAITGADLDRASAAALAETGGGRVTGTEVGDEESYYEVEITLDDGTQVDVQLDESFAVVSRSADHEDEGDDD